MGIPRYDLSRVFGHMNRLVLNSINYLNEEDVLAMGSTPEESVGIRPCAKRVEAVLKF